MKTRQKYPYKIQIDPFSVFFLKTELHIPRLFTPTILEDPSSTDIGGLK